MSVGAGRGDQASSNGYYSAMRVVVRLNRDSRMWSWKSVPAAAHDSPVEHSPTDYSTAQAAIVAAQDHFGPGLTVIV